MAYDKGQNGKIVQVQFGREGKNKDIKTVKNVTWREKCLNSQMEEHSQMQFAETKNKYKRNQQANTDCFGRMESFLYY